MTVTINAVSGTGLTTTSDGSGVVKVQSNGVTTNALAWVNFAGASGTIASSYNVSSVTRTSAGFYTVNFANATSDANYSAIANVGLLTSGGYAGGFIMMYGKVTSPYYVAPTTSGFSFVTLYSNASLSAAQDPQYVTVAVFGN